MTPLSFPHLPRRNQTLTAGCLLAALSLCSQHAGGAKVPWLGVKSYNPQNTKLQDGLALSMSGGDAQVVEAHLTSRDPWKSMDCCNEFKGWIIVPQSGVAASTYGYWRAGFYYPNNNPQYGMAGFMKGDWKPGDRLDFDLPVPKSAMDPSAGNAIQICIGAVEDGPCMQTPNLLTLSVE